MGNLKTILSKARIANLKKTYYYLKKNGLNAALFAVCERMQKTPYDNYQYTVSTEDTLKSQRAECQNFAEPVTISLLVPAYNTDPVYLRELLDSVYAQTYPYWELIIADASEDVDSETCVAQVIKNYIIEKNENRIRYIKLEKNEGISDNSNQALRHVTGEYTGLLDHDDLLTPDALYENAVRIMGIHKNNSGNVERLSDNNKPLLLYSDEDKCDENGANYYEVYKKQDFNLDLLLSNNYFCHFTVMQTELMQKLQFRCNFDGSQDYDLVLRGVAEILPDEQKIIHIPKVLYHWRCHSGSTAVNPQSKRYAYEAGKRALEDFLKAQNWNGSVEHTKHLGFFRIIYEPDVFVTRPDIGVIGGRLLDNKNKITGGIYDADGKCPYEGLRAGFSGYMHQASLQQNADTVDLRCMRVRKELQELFREITGVTYQESKETGIFDSTILPDETDWISLSKAFCKAVKELKYRILWEPEQVETKIK